MTNVANVSGGFGLATQLAMLEIESEQAQYRSDCIIRDASREAKRQHNEQQVRELRDKAGSMMVGAITTGALQIASGAAKVVSVSSRLDAGYAELESTKLDGALRGDSPLGPQALEAKAAVQLRALEARSLADRLCTASTVLSSSADTVKSVFSAVAGNHDAKSARAAHSAEDAKGRADDANDAARRRQTQLDQKLGMLQQLLDAEAETRRAMLRG